MSHVGCEPTLLPLLLEGALSGSEQATIETHLDTCPHCRRELESLAGEPEEWAAASSSLRRDPFDVGILDDGSGTPALIGFDPLADTGGPSIAERSPELLAIELLDPSDNPAALGRLGPYEIFEVIGSGGMGIVLKAFDHELNRYVAIKAMSPGLAGSAAARKRFVRESRAAAAVVHPHVVSIHAVDAAGKLPYLVMPFIPGESLQQRLDREGSLEVRDALRIGMQVARGLAAAHEQGLVHRDVKPANVLLEPGVERALLTDFGLARTVDDATLTASGFIAGTPQYMAPELIEGRGVDHRADLFSLGSVLYAMLTGVPPFRAPAAMAVLRRIVDDQPRPVRELNPDTPRWLAMLIERLHAKQPADRPSSAAEVAELLEAGLAHLQRPDSSPLPERLVEWNREPAAAVRTNSARWRGGGLRIEHLVGGFTLLALVAINLWPALQDRIRIDPEVDSRTEVTSPRAEGTAAPTAPEATSDLTGSPGQRGPAAVVVSPNRAASSSQAPVRRLTGEEAARLDWGDGLEAELSRITNGLNWQERNSGLPHPITKGQSRGGTTTPAEARSASAPAKNAAGTGAGGANSTTPDRSTRSGRERPVNLEVEKRPIVPAKKGTAP